MNSPSSRRHRKRRRAVDPEGSDGDGATPASSNENGIKKRNRRRGAEATVEDTITITNQPRRWHVDGNNARRLNGAADGVQSNVQLIDPREARQARPTRQLNGRNEAANSTRRDSSSASQIPLARNKPSPTTIQSTSKSISSIPASATESIDACNESLGSEFNEDDDYYKYHASTLDTDHTRIRYLKFMVLIYFVANVLALVSLSAVFYTLDFNNKLNMMEKSSLYYSAIERYTTLFQMSDRSAKSFEAQLIETQQLNVHLKGTIAQMEVEHKSEIEEYKSIFSQHNTDMNDALSRINVLRGNKGDKMSALNIAWMRMDELLEENNEPPHHLNDVKKQQLFIARDREMINTVESLTQQLKTASEDKDNLQIVNDDLNTLLMLLDAEYELLEFRYHDLADVILSPVLSYTRRLLHTSERQHTIILELTSLVHSLHSSLELSQSTAQIQSTESQYAIDAIASAAGEAVAQQSARYEMERVIYMEQMEIKLARAEDEAFGAVQAVAEAAGQLEYERKIEEETRWRSYVEEVEKTLGGIGVRTEQDVLSHREKVNRAANVYEKSTSDNAEGIVETSVLRAAISRRIEEGIASLQKYIHPYNYLKEKKSYSWEIKPEPEENQ